MIELWQWHKGRQKADYDVLTLYSIYWHDCHIIWFPTDSSVPPHKDVFYHKMGEIQHFRLNFLLKKAKEGGEFKCRKVIFQWWRIFLFNAARWSHSVSKITKGTRCIISFGFGWPTPTRVDGRYVERD